MSARRRKQTTCAADAPLPPAVVRLYARALEIENEIEEAVADGDYMTVEELLAWSDRLGSTHSTSTRRKPRRKPACCRSIASINGPSASSAACSGSVQRTSTRSNAVS